jgi:hypothetical protein
MAEGKKSFVLYSDQRTIIEMLPNDKAGILLKHIFAYVNDENPINEDPLIMLAFEPIKLQMKRDLIKWEEKIENRSSAGMKSAGKRSFDKWLIEAIEKGIDKISPEEHLFEAGKCAKFMNENFGTSEYFHYQYVKEYHEQMATNPTSVDFVQQGPTNPTVNVNDNVNVTVNVNDNVILLEKETKDNIIKFNFKKTLLDLGFDKKLVSEWLAVRKFKKALNSETALKAFLREVKESNIDKNEILQMCVERSWGSFKIEYLKNLNYNQNGNTNNNKPNGTQQLQNSINNVLEQLGIEANSEESKPNNENGTNDFAEFEVV